MVVWLHRALAVSYNHANLLRGRIINSSPSVSTANLKGALLHRTHQTLSTDVYSENIELRKFEWIQNVFNTILPLPDQYSYNLLNKISILLCNRDLSTWKNSSHQQHVVLQITNLKNVMQHRY